MKKIVSLFLLVLVSCTDNSFGDMRHPFYGCIVFEDQMPVRNFLDDIVEDWTAHNRSIVYSSGSGLGTAIKVPPVRYPQNLGIRFSITRHLTPVPFNPSQIDFSLPSRK
jgi:hypothetical protein